MRQRRLVAVAAVLGLTAAACTGSDSGAARLAVEAGDGALTFPASVVAGLVAVTLTNVGTTNHEAQFVRIDGAHAVEEVVDVLRVDGGPVPGWLHHEGGVASVAAGTSNTATLVLPAGNYFVVDTAVARPFTVTATDSRSTPKLPTAKATITARDYEFTAHNLQAGTHDVRFINAGAEPHVVAALPIVGQSTIDDVRRALAAGTGPPVDFAQGTGAQVLGGGKALVTRMTLRPGRYALACFLSDRAGGPPHFALGMVQEITVA